MDADQEETLRLLLPIAERVISQENDALGNDERETVPESTLSALKEVGGFGLQVPEQWGGAGLGSTQMGRLTEVIGEHDLGLGVFLTGHQGIGYKGILLVGTEEQKERYLPDLAAGRRMAAFALTEPASGSDASSISTRAELSACGGWWELTGGKLWITGGGLADVFTVLAKTAVRDPSTGQTKDKITAFIVERSFGGVTNGPPENKMGIRCSNTAEVWFDRTRVPAANVLGGVGQGFKVAMQILNNGRFGMGTSLSGTMRAVITKAAEHAAARRQFGAQLSAFGSVQERLARMALLHYATESLAYCVAGTMDAGWEEYQIEAAVSKVFSSEAAWWVVDEAIQLLGGAGYMRSTGLEKVQRDLRIFRIFEGTNDILRLFIALTGLQGAGARLRELQGALRAPHRGVGLLAGEAARRVQGRPAPPLLHSALTSQAATLARDVGSLGGAAERLLVRHGKGVVDQQFQLNRLANAAIDLYVSMAVLSRCSASLEAASPSAPHELQCAKLWCGEASSRTRRHLAGITAPASRYTDSQLAEISRAACRAGGVVQPGPLGF